jgi:peptidyl-tRNA hydrolase
MEEIKIQYKQFVIVPKKPKMTTGKIASQVAHAVFMALKNQEYKDKKEYDNIRFNWILNGMCVIVLECKNEQQLTNLAKYLEQWNIPNHLYIDEGLFGCAPFTATALATGVLREDKFWIFENMRLFK